MKNIGHIIVTLLLLIFSFYYTKIVSNIFIDNSILMKKINLNRKKFEYSPVSATIHGDFIIPGVKGREVLKYPSYKKMMRYGNYNEKLFVFKNVVPKITTNNYYLKYINHARSGNKKIALIYVVLDNDNIDNILKILNDNNTQVTFFVDGIFLNNNISLIYDILKFGHQVEIFNNNHSDVYFKDCIKLLESIKNKKSLFCYSDYKNKKLLDYCGVNKLHTVIPTINIKNNLFTNIKNNLADGILIKMPNNTSELNVTISYIKQRGYKLYTLENILKE